MLLEKKPSGGSRKFSKSSSSHSGSKSSQHSKTSISEIDTSDAMQSDHIGGTSGVNKSKMSM